MAKKNTAAAPVPRTRLLRAMENVPDDAPLWCGVAVNDGEDFLQGLCLHKSERSTKARVLAEIKASDFQEFPSDPEYGRYLLITPRLYIWRDDINRSQRFPATPEAEQYVHVQDKRNPYYDIYFRLDKKRKTITFALGGRKKELPVIEHSGWCWKPTKKGLFCSDMDALERDFLDPFWNPIAVDIGRKVLNIRSVV